MVSLDDGALLNVTADGMHGLAKVSGSPSADTRT
jgi:hypothetical protein